MWLKMWYNRLVAQKQCFHQKGGGQMSTETATTDIRKEWLESQGYTPDEVELILKYDGVFED